MTNSEKTQLSPSFIKDLVLRTILCVAAILLFLSLISYNPEDTQILEGGLGAYATTSNWIGLFGAWIAGKLLVWLGYAAHAASILILVCVGNRLIGKHLKPVNFVYLAGIAVTILGCAMMLGIFPGFLDSLSRELNIAEIPGGVIGQRFCAPWSVGERGGWLAYVVNPTGSVIISLSMIIVGLVTVWHFDWQIRSAMLNAAVREWWKNRDTTAAASLDDAFGAEPIHQKYTDPEVALNVEEPLDKSPPGGDSADDTPAVVSPKRQNASSPAKKIGAKQKRSAIRYRLPGIELLNKSSAGSTLASPQEVEAKKRVLQETLDSFNIDASVGDTTSGPRVTLFEIKPAPGVKVERISSLANNISMNLKAESMRILTPIPGKDTVGIEVPNRTSSSVSIRDMFESPYWKKSKAAIPVALGKNINGQPALLDMAKAPHLLIAGATGSGKSVCMNTLMLSLLYRFSPDELKLILVDPKVVEFSGYNSLPHLVTPVVTSVKKVPLVLRWAIKQMEWRYEILSKAGVRNIAGFNSRTPAEEEILDDEGDPIPERLPYLIIIIDELADIMMTAKSEVETSLARIAQLARAVGIHVIVATQRPSVNVITGIIKANFPTRIAFQVTSVVDSRTILDGKGAESLLGRGDMLFKPPGGSKLERTQGAMVDDLEIERVVKFVSEQAQPEYLEEILSLGKGSGDSKTDNSSAGAVRTAGPAIDLSSDATTGQADGDEELIKKAIDVIIRDRRATTSHIQRRLRIGYNRAALVIEELERRGIVGPQVGTAPRQILIEETGSDE